MVLSMTGFGRSEGIFNGLKISVEVKSLNSKNLDLNLRLPIRYKELEFDLRKIINHQIQRGKIDFIVYSEVLEDYSELKINQSLILSYISVLKECANDGPDYEYLKMALKMPDAITNQREKIENDEKLHLFSLVDSAISDLIGFRKTEGKSLEIELQTYIENIHSCLNKVTIFESERMISVKEKYQNILQDFQNIDETRLYQELAYYTEKLDISEEKARLMQHLAYFLEVMTNEESNGKKLGFICQEIGREINTIGSKANHSEIQKLVVMMKDDLEKIKEQCLNIL